MSDVHLDSHPLAGKIVTIAPFVICPRDMVFPGARYVIEDWADVVGNKDWHLQTSNWAVFHYQNRMAINNLPDDQDVLYGKIDGIGHCVHVSEIIADS